jgi:hypothetical protein
MALEGLYLPSGASWVSALRSELLSFPAGKHDDQVDALGLIGQLLDIIQPGQHPAKPEIKPQDLAIGQLVNWQRSLLIGCCSAAALDGRKHRDVLGFNLA